MVIINLIHVSYYLQLKAGRNYYFHVRCIFLSFDRARSKTITSLDDIENHENLQSNDKTLILKLIQGKQF